MRYSLISQTKGEKMFEVKCPECPEGQNIRLMQHKQHWMKGEQPYIRHCKKHCQTGKPKSDETKAKLRESVKALQTEEVLKKKSEDRLARPDLIEKLADVAHTGGGGWNKGLSLPGLSEETKKKISEGVKKTRGKKK